MCHPEVTVLGYICKCPEGKTGSLCDRDKGAHCKGPDCYDGMAISDITFHNYCFIVVNKAMLDKQLNFILLSSRKNSSVLPRQELHVLRTEQTC